MAGMDHVATTHSSSERASTAGFPVFLRHRRLAGDRFRPPAFPDARPVPPGIASTAGRSWCSSRQHRQPGGLRRRAILRGLRTAGRKTATAGSQLATASPQTCKAPGSRESNERLRACSTSATMKRPGARSRRSSTPPRPLRKVIVDKGPRRESCRSAAIDEAGVIGQVTRVSRSQPKSR